jgi:large subunit ribosomal protein L21
MYAVIEQGGKQYKVTEGDRLDIELTDVQPDATEIELNKVLFIGDGENVRIGKPYIEGAKVTAKFETTAEKGLIKGKKLYVTHFRRRKDSQRRIGHRQKYLRVTIAKIEG